jgi:bacteriocin-like protein
MNTNKNILTDKELDTVTGGQQVYVHQFGIGSVNIATGLRPFEPRMPASPDPEAGLGAYGSTDNNLPG